jgi:hypothetical protein
MPREYQQKTIEFFEKIASKESERAIDELFQGNPWIFHSMDQVNYLKSQFIGLESALGEFIDYHILVDKIIGHRYAIQYCLVFYERQPIKMEFHFYKPNDEWRIQSLNFSAEISDDLSNLVKNYLGADLV